MERTDISILPEVLLEKIMVRVPLESLGKCSCVCRKWRSKIREEEFERLYWAQSMTRPRLLFKYGRTFPERSDHNILFQSVYQQEEPLLSSGLKQMPMISLPPVNYRMFCAPQRGLACLEYETKFVLCNPATNKVKALPECQRLHPVRKSTIFCSFGYDEDTKVFKFLISEVHNDIWRPREFSHKVLQQVFTVKLAELDENIKEKPWRVIESQHNHVPVTRSLCLKGVLYYGAKSLVDKDKSMIISFDMRSEKFTIIDMPEGVELAYVGDILVNYNGEVCLVKDSWNVGDDGTRVYHEIYVKDENAIGKWRKVTVVIPRLGDDVWSVSLWCAGTIGTTEELVLVFGMEYVMIKGPPLVLYYNTATRNVRLFEIDGVDASLYFTPRIFVNHYDSLLLK